MGAACGVVSRPKKILLTGPPGAGKTTLLYAWCLQRDVDTHPTENFNVETVYGTRDKQLLIIWDAPPSHRRRQLFYGIEGVVYVVPRNSPCLDEVRADLHTTMRDRDLNHLPLLLVVSKSELQGPSQAEMEDLLGLSSLTTFRVYSSTTTSTTSMESFRNALNELCEMMYP